jgi:very-short-patch-repair endonuclease
MRRKLVEADRLVARIAARQHGVISVAQLRAAGLDSAAVARRVAAGRLHPVHRGVYAVGHMGLGSKGRWMAAVLASGAGAVLSHTSAAMLWCMLDEADGVVHVTVPVAGGRGRRNGIRIHRHPSLPRSARTSRDNIPVTSPQRTLEDLKRDVDPGVLRQAIRQAELRRLPVDAAALVGDRAASPLELAFLQLCQRHHLPEPEANARVGPYRVDFLWREQLLVVETDGRRYHRGLIATEDDRERDRYLRKIGYEVLRFTYEQVTESPRVVATEVRAALNRSHSTT